MTSSGRVADRDERGGNYRTMVETVKVPPGIIEKMQAVRKAPKQKLVPDEARLLAAKDAGKGIVNVDWL